MERDASEVVDDIERFATWIEKTKPGAWGETSNCCIQGEGEFKHQSISYYLCRGGTCPELCDRILYYRGMDYWVVRDVELGRRLKKIILAGTWRTHEAAYGKHAVLVRRGE